MNGWKAQGSCTGSHTDEGRDDVAKHTTTATPKARPPQPVHNAGGNE